MFAIDLFSGAGGLSYGLERAGIVVEHAVEADKWAAETYAHNLPHVDLRIQDIRNINDGEIGDWIRRTPDVIVGGPPCQGFSHSNTFNRDPKDPRNSLFIDFLRFVRVLQPSVCLIENVKGLLVAVNEHGEKVINIIRDAFEEIGYSCEYRLLDAADFGVPQHRERLFIIAVRADLNVPFSWPTPTHGTTAMTTAPMQLFSPSANSLPYVTLWDAISDLPQVTSDDASVEQTYRSKPQNDYQNLMRKGANRLILNHEPMRHTRRVIERFRNIAIGQSEEDVPHELKPRRRGRPSESSGYAYSQNSRRQSPNEPCNTIVASSHTNFIHPFLDRNFTVREMLRIQSFPDHFVVKGKRAVLSFKLSQRKGLVDDIFLDQRMQIGNAVPPLLAQEFARSMLSSMPREANACA